MVIPNEVNIFGSVSHEVNLGKCQWGSSQRLSIKRVHTKALDQQTYRCESETRSINTSGCIAEFIEKQIGCNPNIQGSQYSTRPTCTTKSQLLQLKHYLDKFLVYNSNEVYHFTGCLSSCEKDIFSLVKEPITCKDNWLDLFYLDLTITDRWHKEEEEYIIYDTDSFIADVGGY